METLDRLVESNAEIAGLEVARDGVGGGDLALNVPPHLLPVHVLGEAPLHGVLELGVREDLARERELV